MYEKCSTFFRQTSTSQLTYPGIICVATKKLGLIGSVVLTLIGTEKLTSQIYKGINIFAPQMVDFKL